MRIALSILAGMYFLLFVRAYTMVTEIEAAFLSVNLPNQRFLFGKLFSFIFVVIGSGLLIAAFTKRLDYPKKKTLFVIALVVLFVLGGSVMAWIASDISQLLYLDFNSGQ